MLTESRNTVASSVLGSEVQSTLETTVELTDREKLTQEWDDLSKVRFFLYFSVPKKHMVYLDLFTFFFASLA